MCGDRDRIIRSISDIFCSCNVVTLPVVIVLSIVGGLGILFGLGLFMGYLAPGGATMGSCYIEDGTITFWTFLRCLYPGLIGLSLVIIIIFIIGMIIFYFIQIKSCCEQGWEDAKLDECITEYGTIGV